MFSFSSSALAKIVLASFAIEGVSAVKVGSIKKGSWRTVDVGSAIQPKKDEFGNTIPDSYYDNHGYVVKGNTHFGTTLPNFNEDQIERQMQAVERELMPEPLSHSVDDTSAESIEQTDPKATVTHFFKYKKDQETKDHAVYALKTKDDRIIRLRYSKWLKVAKELNKHMTTSFFRRNRHAAFATKPAPDSYAEHDLEMCKSTYETLKTNTNWKSSDVSDAQCNARNGFILQWYDSWVLVAGDDADRKNLFEAAVAAQLPKEQ